MGDKKVIRDARHYFAKGKLCLTNLVSFCDGVNPSVEKRRCVIYLDFCKAFGKASFSIPAAVVRVIWFDKWTL